MDKHIRIMELQKWGRWDLSEKINKIVKEKIGFEDFINEESMVFNRLHMATFIVLFEDLAKQEKTE